MSIAKQITHAVALIATASAGTALAAPMTYTLDPGHSAVNFSYLHNSFSHQQQRFNKVIGTVTFDPEAKTGSVDATIDMTSVDVTGGSKLGEDIQKERFFDTAHYPTATFKSTSVKFDGDQPVSVTGDLTVKGVTHRITLALSYFKQGINLQKRPSIGADATAHLSRKEFNMGAAEPAVGDDVTVDVDFEAHAGGASRAPTGN